MAPLRTDGPGQSIAAHPAGGTHRRPRTLALHSIYNETEGVEWRDKRRPSGGTSDGSGGRWETRVATADGRGGGLMGEQDQEGRRGQATDAAWGRAADAEGTRDGCCSGDRRRMRRLPPGGTGGGRERRRMRRGQARGGGRGGVRQRASRDAEARLHGERDAEANWRGVQAIYSSDLQQRRHDTAA